MAHFAVIAPPLRGHYSPLSSLAAELIARGHRVTFVHQPDAAPLVEARGANFHAIGADAPSLDRWTGPMARIKGLLGLGGMMDRMVGFIDMFGAEGPAALRAIGADAIIADQLEPSGGLLAEHLGLPFVSVADALPINREPGVPPPYVGWDYDGTEKGERRNLGGYKVSDLIMRGIGQAIERNALRLGLRPRRLIEECLSPALQISQAVPGMDFPRSELPDTFHYVGPMRREAPASDFSLPRAGRPLVYCALGTLQGSRVGIFRKVAAACAALDLQLIISQGGLSHIRPLGRLPGSTLVFDWVPQRTVLAQADLVVSHAGFNTVMETVAAGLPMVLMPLAFEQPAIAARVRYAGVGRTVTRHASVRTLKSAIGDALRNPAYRVKAAAVRSQVGAAGGVTRAADLIERTLL